MPQNVDLTSAATESDLDKIAQAYENYIAQKGENGPHPKIDAVVFLCRQKDMKGVENVNKMKEMIVSCQRHQVPVILDITAIDESYDSQKDESFMEQPLANLPAESAVIVENIAKNLGVPQMMTTYQTAYFRKDDTTRKFPIDLLAFRLVAMFFQACYAAQTKRLDKNQERKYIKKDNEQQQLIAKDPEEEKLTPTVPKFNFLVPLIGLLLIVGVPFLAWMVAEDE